MVFADFGDTLELRDADANSLSIGGRFGEGLDAGDTNLVTRALASAERLGASPAAVTLTKDIPIAAGLGGGSADAAAVLRARLLDTPERDAAALALGADVPACVVSRTLRMTGIGETVRELPGLGQVQAVLANPGVAVSTAAIFKAFDSAPAKETPRPQAVEGDLLSRALDGRNDLQPIAVALQPVIGELIRTLEATKGCQLARMTGSGASVFAIYPEAALAEHAAATLSERGVWARACRLGDAG